VTLVSILALKGGGISRNDVTGEVSMKRSSISPLEFSIGLLVLGIAVAIPYSRMKPGWVRSQCQTNLKQIALGIQQYASDWGNHLPPVAITPVAVAKVFPNRPFGWADAVQPYVKSSTVFQCPAEWNDAADEPWQPGYTDYYFNDIIESVDLMTLNNSANTVLNGEGGGDFKQTTGRFARHSIPQPWRVDENSLVAIHLGGANYAFVDGHVKWLGKASYINSCRDSCCGSCFSFCP
jgi:prepilin-type processing-associated H-X9-DG protein